MSIKKIVSSLRQPPKNALFNSILLSIAIALNLFFQVFCIPVNWAIGVIAVCFVHSTFLPLLIQHKKLLPIVSFLNGISFCLFVYCILFMNHLNYLGVAGILFFGIGIFTYIPHFFVIQIAWIGFLQLPSKIGKLFFILGISVCILVAICAVQEYKKAIVDIQNFKESNYQELHKTFMTERILGIGIIYHTEFCEYDGWRPPIHDPVLNIGYWLNGSKNPLQLSLENRVALYKKFFPEKTLKFDCSCAWSYRQDYHEDDLWL